MADKARLSFRMDCDLERMMRWLAFSLDLPKQQVLELAVRRLFAQEGNAIVSIIQSEAEAVAGEVGNGNTQAQKAQELPTSL